MIHMLYPLTVLTGVVFGLFDIVPQATFTCSLPHILLYLLIIQVGLTLGLNPDLKTIFKSFNLRLLTLPLCTIAGTLVCTLIATLIFREDSISDIMAIGSGFGYYTLSSMLISQYKVASVGVDAAAVLASVALLTNVVREMIALISCNFLSKKGHSMVAISVAGINSMDVCLPMIVGGYRDKAPSNLMPMALVHGLVLEISVPVLVAFFCG